MVSMICQSILLAFYITLCKHIDHDTNLLHCNRFCKVKDYPRLMVMFYADKLWYQGAGVPGPAVPPRNLTGHCSLPIINHATNLYLFIHDGLNHAAAFQHPSLMSEKSCKARLS